MGDSIFFQVISEKEDARYPCPLNPPILGDFEIRTPQTGGQGSILVSPFLEIT
jgi:hypothetical protein